MVVYGIYTFGKVRQRAAALKTLIGTLDRKASLVMVGDFLEATVKAADAIRDGTIAAVAGSLDDVALPPEHEGFGEVEWRESWLAYLEQSKVAFLPLKTDRPSQNGSGAVASIIRGYNRAAGALEESIRKYQSEQRRGEKVAQGGYVCGRPPYGYRAQDESFVVNKRQAAAVEYIFKQCRAGKPLTYIINGLKDKHSAGGVIHGKPQYWDRVKVRRILNHSRLYCLGQYEGGRGQPIHLPGLAFLPASWVGTRPNTRVVQGDRALAAGAGRYPP